MATPEPVKLYRADIAARQHISVRSLGRAKLPPPDGHTMEAGHARPWWWESTYEAWASARPGKEWRRGRTGSIRRPQ